HSSGMSSRANAPTHYDLQREPRPVLEPRGKPDNGQIALARPKGRRLGAGKSTPLHTKPVSRPRSGGVPEMILGFTGCWMTARDHHLCYRLLQELERSGSALAVALRDRLE